MLTRIFILINLIIIKYIINISVCSKTKFIKGAPPLLYSCMHSNQYKLVYRVHIHPTFRNLKIFGEKTFNMIYLRILIIDYRLQIADCRLQIADCRIRITDYRLQITNCRLQITDNR